MGSLHGDQHSSKDEANIQQVRDGKRGVVGDVLGLLSLLRLKQKVKLIFINAIWDVFIKTQLY